MACGFSGHGFKFVPVVGEILADLVQTGTTAHDIDLFDVARPALRGRRFAPTGRGTYVLRSELAERTLVRAALLTLPSPTLAASVTGLRLLGVMVGSPEPIRFVTTHPRQVRRQGIRVRRIASLPPHRDSVAFPSTAG